MNHLKIKSDVLGTKLPKKEVLIHCKRVMLLVDIIQRFL
jgi:hypothetical protein